MLTRLVRLIFTKIRVINMYQSPLFYDKGLYSNMFFFSLKLIINVSRICYLQLRTIALIIHLKLKILKNARAKNSCLFALSPLFAHVEKIPQLQ